MSWGEIRSLGCVVRPLSDPKPPRGNRYSPFSASITSTVETLATELGQLRAKNVVLEIDLRERDIRADGFPRADARPTHPGVAVAFESKYGPLRYATAEFDGRWGEHGWQANLRAIALAMEALRKVDRYGVSKRGEQYQGWKQIPRSTDAADQIQTEEQARELIDHYGGLAEALKATHPDRGGNPDDFRRVIRAKELIEA